MDEDKELIAKTKELSAYLAELSNSSETVAELNAYFIMEQEVDSALSKCMQTLYLIRKEKEGKTPCKSHQ